MENVILLLAQWAQPPLMWGTHSGVKEKDPSALFCSFFYGDTAQEMSMLGSKCWPSGSGWREGLLSTGKPSARKMRLLLPQNNGITSVRHIRGWSRCKLKPNSAKAMGLGSPLKPSIPWILSYQNLLDFLTNVTECPS